MRFTLSDVAQYFVTGKALAPLRRLIRNVRRIFTFHTERDNRIARYMAIANAYKNGTPVNEIAKKWGCDKTTVLRYARMAGLEKRPKHLPKQIQAEVIADYKTGIPVATIAKKHGVSQAYVSSTASKLGIKRRNHA